MNRIGARHHAGAGLGYGIHHHYGHGPYYGSNNQGRQVHSPNTDCCFVF